METHHDVEVDVLGGLCGAAYRRGFFDLWRLADYGSYASGAPFYVDDDVIAGALASSGVRRIVLGAEAVPRTASAMLGAAEAIVPEEDAGHGGLNARDHRYRAVGGC